MTSKPITRKALTLMMNPQVKIKAAKTAKHQGISLSHFIENCVCNVLKLKNNFDGKTGRKPL